MLFSKNQSRFIHGSFTLYTLYSRFIHALFMSVFKCDFVLFPLPTCKLLVYCNPCNINIFLCIVIAKTTLIPLQNIICFHHATIQIPFTFCTPIHALFTLNHAFSHLITLTIHAPEIDQQQISHKSSHKS